MFIISSIMKLFRVSFAIMTLLMIAINRWMAFVIRLSMMFVLWNSLLTIIGIVSTVQMALGFCFDVMKVTSGRMMLTGSKSSATLKDRNEGIEGYWQSRRKAYQEMVDKLYTGYMERLIGVQQQQAQYWEHSQYMYSQPRYQNQNGDVYVDDHRNAEYYPQYHHMNDDFYYRYDDDDELTMMDNGEGSSDRNYETNSDGMSEGSSFMPDIKITEDTSATIME